LLEGNEPQARLHVDALLSLFPTNIAGLTFRMYLQENSDQPDLARQTAERAINEVYAQTTSPREPPRELLHHLGDLRDRLTLSGLSFSRVSDQLTLAWEGRPGTPYKLQSSSDLQTWVVRSTNFLVTSNIFTWTTDLSAPHQFFRVIH